MIKLPEVALARATMIEAIDWSVMKWLTEKKKVRTVADAANLALDNQEAALREQWNAPLKAAYAKLASGAEIKGIPADLAKSAKAIKQAHDLALSLRMEAEHIFDKAEKRLSTSMAREGCHKAIEGWDRHEEAIGLAENAVRAVVTKSHA